MHNHLRIGLAALALGVTEAGQALCLEVFNGLTTAKLHGFVAKDR